MGVYVHNNPSFIGTMLFFGWLAIGLFCTGCYVLSQEEAIARDHDFKMKLKDDWDKCKCRKCQPQKITVGSILLGIIGIPFMVLFMACAGPLGLIHVLGDDYHTESWSYIKRLDAQYNLFRYSALALPVLALATLWWM